MARLPRGSAEVTLDAKGRVAVPAKFRPIFDDRYPMLWDAQHPRRCCLLLTHEQHFDDVIADEMELISAEYRADHEHNHITHVEDVDLDANGRFVLGEKWYEKFGFVRGEKLVLLANKEYIEIWSLPKWQELLAQTTPSPHAIDYTPRKPKVAAHE